MSKDDESDDCKIVEEEGEGDEGTPTSQSAAILALIPQPTPDEGLSWAVFIIYQMWVCRLVSCFSSHVSSIRSLSETLKLVDDQLTWVRVDQRAHLLLK